MTSRRQKLRYYAAGLSTFLLFGLSLTFSYIWLIAFVRGGTARVSVNRFGEQWIELVLIFGVVWPVIIYGTYWTMRFQDVDRWLRKDEEY
jgi:hypothetical protein